MKCRICGMEMKLIDIIENCVEGHVYFGEKPYQLPTKKVELYQCAICGHAQIDNLIEDTYYDVYECRDENTTAYYAYTENIYDERLKKLQSLNGGKSLLDIGCGTGDLLSCAQKYYDKCVGVEPSSSEYAVAKERGYKVTNSYFDDSFNMDEKFDAFTCNMVFEHLENPATVLQAANRILNRGGAGLINIPDGEMIIRKGLYHQFLTEHINYYSLCSISKLVQDCGFSIQSIERDSKLLELNVFVCKNNELKNISEIISDHRNMLLSMIKECHNIVLWGAGTKAASYSFLIKGIPVSGIVDSDEKKEGKYVSGINHPVEKVSRERILCSDTIIILASSYNKEILVQIEEMGYTGKIIYFDNETNMPDMKIMNA